MALTALATIPRIRPGARTSLPERRIRPALLALCGATALAACGDAPPAQPPERIENPDLLPGLPAMGRERRIVVVTDGVLSGEGLMAQDRFPARIEAALRAHGVNARVTAIAPGRLATLPVDPARRPELIVAARPLAGPAPGGARVLVPDFAKAVGADQPDGEAIGDMVAASRDLIAGALPTR